MCVYDSLYVLYRSATCWYIVHIIHKCCTLLYMFVYVLCILFMLSDKFVYVMNYVSNNVWNYVLNMVESCVEYILKSVPVFFKKYVYVL